MGIFLFLVISISIIIYVVYRSRKKEVGKNIFSTSNLNKQTNLNTSGSEENILEKSKRDAVLKQRFLLKKVPENVDAIVIGSGIGGLSTAALLAKAGKKVVVLEQHDQAGGCCHTFVEKGFEFDVGIHYVGEVGGNTLTKCYVDQISDGNIKWTPVDNVIDRVQLPGGSYDVVTGKGKWREELQRTFPSEHQAIDKYFTAMKDVRKVYTHLFILKSIPLAIANFLVKTGILGLFTSLPYYINTSLADFLDSITNDENLKAVLSYSFGDYGTQPRESSLLMQLLLMQHYAYGGFYPVGGASEIALNIIPVIERSGGKVLVNAKVCEIIVQDGQAIGVNIDRKGEKIPIHAGKVISACGIINTFKTLLPDSITCKSVYQLLNKVQSGHGAISVYIGLEGSNEDLGLSSTNTWAFTDCNHDRSLDNYLSTPLKEVGKSDIPLMFISFPSTKDPLWNERFPGKSNCTIVTLANYEWFEQWKDERVNKRSADYVQLKNRIAERCWEQTLRYYPQLKDKRVYFEVGTPLSNNYYIGAPRGEIYGLDHNMARFNLNVAVQLRATTPVKNLYLTGQDISTGGFAGGLYAGLLTASAILNRNLMNDLVAAKNNVKKMK